jgi:hypothetical protein
MMTSALRTLSPAPMIVQAVLSLDPIRVLDLGIGTGKYGFLLREQTPRVSLKWLAATRNAEGALLSMKAIGRGA